MDPRVRSIYGLPAVLDTRLIITHPILPPTIRYCTDEFLLISRFYPESLPEKRTKVTKDAFLVDKIKQNKWNNYIMSTLANVHLYISKVLVAEMKKARGEQSKLTDKIN